MNNPTSPSNPPPRRLPRRSPAAAGQPRHQPGGSPAAARPGRDGLASHYQRTRAVTVPDGHLVVGHVVGIHGLRGELKVEPYTDFPERFVAGASLLVGTSLRPMVITAVRDHKNHLLIQLAGISDRTMAEDYRDTWLFVPEHDAIPLEEGTYWIHEIIGMVVTADDGEVLGTIVDVLATGANDVYVVQPPASSERARELLIPAIADVVLNVDLAAGVLTVHLPEGLLDV